jgi:N-acetylglucosamine-6-phosphate deacetylase
VQKTLTGKDVGIGSPLEVAFDETIEVVRPSTAHPEAYLCPGWVDVQVNGFAGVDYNSGATSHEEIARSIEVLFSTGVTRFYPTVITGGPDDMRAALDNLARAKDVLRDGEAMDGFHVEGPHISPDDGPRGAHPRHWVRPPDVDEFHRWQEAARGGIRLVTLAPAIPTRLRGRSAMPCRPALPCRPISATARTRCCSAIQTIFGSSWPRIV